MVHSMLQNIQIVLVQTSHPGNIGGVARAMKNMRLSELSLVQPQLYPHPDANARASGADDVLQNARVCASLDQALSGCAVVVGASARIRRLKWPQLTPRECAQLVLRHCANDEPVAVVFGREHSGLTNEELERCQYLVHIPSNPQYSSLNLAAAVQLIAYEIHSAWLVLHAEDERPAQYEQGRSLDAQPLASAGDMERFYQHLFQVLTEIGFLQTEHPRKMKRRLRRLYNRTHLDRVELNILRGILTTIQKSLRRCPEELQKGD